MLFGEKTNVQTFQKTDKSSFRKTQMDKHFKKQYTRDRNKCNNTCYMYKQFAPPPSPPPKKKQKLSMEVCGHPSHPKTCNFFFCIRVPPPPPQTQAPKKDLKRLS